jgi:alkylation response protein AidB-like acyl-CoA dehydrogenase
MPEPVNGVLDRARDLAPRIAAAAEEIERGRRLPDPLVAALHAAGLFRMLLPQRLGGAALDPPTFVQVTEAIARADASTAWVICQTNGCSMTAAYLHPDVARAIFGGEPVGVLAWGPPTTSTAVVAEGGYRLSGTFNFASGSRHATWLGGQAQAIRASYVVFKPTSLPIDRGPILAGGTAPSMIIVENVMPPLILRSSV